MEKKWKDRFTYESKEDTTGFGQKTIEGLTDREKEQLKKELGLTELDDIELSGRMTPKDKHIVLKIIQVLKHWEDADIFNLKVKMMIAEHIHNEVKSEYIEKLPRGL